VLRCGNGVEGNRDFLVGLVLLPPYMLPGGVLAAGDANERDRALSGEMSAGPRGEWPVGPTFEADVSAKLRYQGLSESKWCETVNEKREDEHEPILAADVKDEGSNRRDEARG
jgi:hypothetical protein